MFSLIRAALFFSGRSLVFVRIQNAHKVDVLSPPEESNSGFEFAVVMVPGDASVLRVAPALIARFKSRE